MASKLAQHVRACQNLLQPNSNKIYTVVIGNEACDIDTAACTLAYSYFLKQVRKIDNLPVFNLRRQHFKLKTETVFLLKKVGLESQDLLFADDLLEKARGNPLRAYLVDCNAYAGPLTAADNTCTGKMTVVGALDHHKLQDPNFENLEALVASLEDSQNSEVKVGLGSCSTIIFERFAENRKLFAGENDLPTFEEIAKLLYSAVTVDTTNFSENVGVLGKIPFFSLFSFFRA